MENVFEICSISDALKLIDKISQEKDFLGKIQKSAFPFGLFFRGHASEKFKLLPSIFRNQDSSCDLPNFHGFALTENEIFRNAQRKFRYTARESDRQLYTLFDWLSVLQHYEIPTRLLDWTENMAIALHFATADDTNAKHQDDNAKVFILNARSLNDNAGHEKASNNLNTADTFSVKLRTSMIISNTRESWRKTWKDDYDDSRWRDDHGQALLEDEFSSPIAVLPNYLNERMFLQSALFTLHGGKLYHKSEKKIFEEKSVLPHPSHLEDINSKLISNNKIPFLIEAIIPSRCKGIIAKELSYLGIHPGTIRPELEYQSAYFKRTAKS